MSDTELNELMSEFVKQKTLISEAKKVKANLRSKMLTILKVKDIDRYVDEDNNVLSLKMTPRTTLDSEKVKEFLGDKLEDYMVTSETEYLRVTEPKEPSGGNEE